MRCTPLIDCSNIGTTAVMPSTDELRFRNSAWKAMTVPRVRWP